MLDFIEFCFAVVKLVYLTVDSRCYYVLDIYDYFTGSIPAMGVTRIFCDIW